MAPAMVAVYLNATANSDFDKFTPACRTKFIIVFRHQCGGAGDINFCTPLFTYKLADVFLCARTRVPIDRTHWQTIGDTYPPRCNYEGLLKCARVSNRMRRVRLSDVKTRRYIFRNETPARLASLRVTRVTVLIIANAFFRRNGSVLTVNQRPIRLSDNRIVLSDGTIFFTELSSASIETALTGKSSNPTSDA